MFKSYEMNKDIAEFDIYTLTKSGKLIQIFWIKSTDDYNHFRYALHHFILKQEYKKNKKWFEERGIKQKLILLPRFIHNQVHQKDVIKILSDKDFEAHFKISRWALLFNRKHSNY